ncbi:MAG: helix-turn-helix transcriptional regulator [Prevotella sp.]|nr:helix-turn-helix transcriptional regulator [Prevotella sp.]
MFAKRVGIDPGNFSKKINGIQTWTIFDVNKICNNTNVSRYWLTDGEGKMLKAPGDTDPNDFKHKMAKLPSDFDEITKPRLPVNATAGHLTEFIDGVMAYQCEQMPIIRRFPDYDFTMYIRGNSMEPKYEGGDEIALKKATIIEWGKDYVLDTEDGPIFKKIYEEGDNIRCVSYNHNEYPDFFVPKTSIRNYYRFVGLVRV